MLVLVTVFLKLVHLDLGGMPLHPVCQHLYTVVLHVFAIYNSSPTLRASVAIGSISMLSVPFSRGIHVCTSDIYLLYFCM